MTGDGARHFSARRPAWMAQALRAVVDEPAFAVAVGGVRRCRETLAVPAAQARRGRAVRGGPRNRRRDWRADSRSATPARRAAPRVVDQAERALFTARLYRLAALAFANRAASPVCLETVLARLLARDLRAGERFILVGRQIIVVDLLFVR